MILKLLLTEFLWFQIFSPLLDPDWNTSSLQLHPIQEPVQFRLLAWLEIETRWLCSPKILPGTAILVEWLSSVHLAVAATLGHVRPYPSSTSSTSSTFTTVAFSTTSSSASVISLPLLHYIISYFFYYQDLQDFWWGKTETEQEAHNQNAQWNILLMLEWFLRVSIQFLQRTSWWYGLQWCHSCLWWWADSSPQSNSCCMQHITAKPPPICRLCSTSFTSNVAQE